MDANVSFPGIKRLRKQANEALRALPLELARSILKVWEKMGENLNAWSKTFVKLGMEGMKEAYGDNIGIVLNYISQIARNCSRNIILTSDHGELLGEFKSLKQGTGHPPNRKDRELREVPWLEVNN